LRKILRSASSSFTMTSRAYCCIFDVNDIKIGRALLSGPNRIEPFIFLRLVSMIIELEESEKRLAAINLMIEHVLPIRFLVE
jgi:hypothetical protein